MGDFLAPKRRDVVDRLRRRIEGYRTHNNHAFHRFNVNRVGLYEQQVTTGLVDLVMCVV
jgi:hypothetical protein